MSGKASMGMRPDGGSAYLGKPQLLLLLHVCGGAPYVGGRHGKLLLTRFSSISKSRLTT